MKYLKSVNKPLKNSSIDEDDEDVYDDIKTYFWKLAILFYQIAQVLNIFNLFMFWCFWHNRL